MSGRPELGEMEQLRLGQEIMIARHGGVGWKQLEHVHDRSRRQLWRYCLRAMALEVGAKNSSLFQGRKSA